MDKSSVQSDSERSSGGGSGAACRTGKLSYATPAEAARAVELVARRTSTHSASARKRFGNSKLMHYRCQFCKQWHIGHTNLGEKRA